MSPQLMKELVRTGNYHSEGNTASIVRLPTHGHEWIAWALDAGASGVVLPHTETPEQARQAVASARFPPEGHRSFPPLALIPGMTDGLPEGVMLPLEMWNKNGAVIMQIVKSFQFSFLKKNKILSVSLSMPDRNLERVPKTPTPSLL